MEGFGAGNTNYVLDENNVAHSLIDRKADRSPFSPKALFRCLHYLACRKWCPHTIMKESRHELYSEAMSNLISNGVVTVTNKSSNEDDVNVVDYAINRGLYIVSKDRFRDLIQCQSNGRKVLQLQDYSD